MLLNELQINNFDFNENSITTFKKYVSLSGVTGNRVLCRRRYVFKYKHYQYLFDTITTVRSYISVNL